MLLINPNGTAMYPFPCPLCIINRTVEEDGKSVVLRVIACGEAANFAIASYHELVPAKMEIARLLGAFKENPDQEFWFMKDPDREG